jgi:peptidoglycan/xylan/chitin deacetylase (PgdA/CDA1 family)
MATATIEPVFDEPTTTPGSGEASPGELPDVEPTTTVLSQESSAIEPTIPPPPPHEAQLPFNKAAFIGKTIESVRTNRREVAITFDDGPCANTEKVLAILKKHDAKATFFFVGARAEHQSLYVWDTISQGHEVGNHTWNHAELRGMDPPALGEEIDRAQRMLELETGSAPLFVRPRSGKLDKAAAKAIWSRGLLLVLWSTHPGDVAPSPKPEAIVRGATRGTKPGSIILMHETNANTVVALPAILDELHRRNLKPVTLSELLAHAKP